MLVDTKSRSVSCQRCRHHSVLRYSLSCFCFVQLICTFLQSVYVVITTDLSLSQTYSFWAKTKCCFVIGLAFLGTPIISRLNRWNSLHVKIFKILLNQELRKGQHLWTRVERKQMLQRFRCSHLCGLKYFTKTTTTKRSNLICLFLVTRQAVN